MMVAKSKGICEKNSAQVTGEEATRRAKRDRWIYTVVVYLCFMARVRVHM